MAHLIIKSEARRRGILALGRLIASGCVKLRVSPLRNLDQITGFAPEQSIRFGSFKFTADLGGNLFLTGALVSPEDPACSVDSAIKPLLNSFGESHPDMDLALGGEPISFSEYPNSVTSASVKKAQSCNLGPALVRIFPEIIREINSSDFELSD